MATTSRILSVYRRRAGRGAITMLRYQEYLERAHRAVSWTTGPVANQDAVTNSDPTRKQTATPNRLHKTSSIQFRTE